MNRRDALQVVDASLPPAVDEAAWQRPDPGEDVERGDHPRRAGAASAAATTRRSSFGGSWLTAATAVGRRTGRRQGFVSEYPYYEFVARPRVDPCGDGGAAEHLDAGGDHADAVRQPVPVG
jgi:hypothetical protein